MNISKIESTLETISGKLATQVVLSQSMTPAPKVNVSPVIQPSPAVNVFSSNSDMNFAPVVSPADVNVQPLLQSSPVVNVPPSNLSEISATPLNVSILNDMPELGNVIVQAIKSISNKNDAVQSQAFNSPLSIQPAPVSIQPPDVFAAPLDLSGFGKVISSLIDNLENKDTSIKLERKSNTPKDL